jgi:branched-chain amino acid transport system ATP-binding protein
VRFDGRTIIGLPTHRIARRGIGRTFQVAATFASMTVREGIALALAAHEGRDAAVLAAPMPMRPAAADALMRRLQIDDLADAHCAALAYGDAKRVELALALAGEPRLLLMDEPTAGMAPRARRELMQLADELARADGVAVLFTEHDMDIVFGFADRIVVLDRGALIAQGPPAEIRANRRVQAVYLGLEEPAADRWGRARQYGAAAPEAPPTFAAPKRCACRRTAAALRVAGRSSATSRSDAAYAMRPAVIVCSRSASYSGLGTAAPSRLPRSFRCTR